MRVQDQHRSRCSCSGSAVLNCAPCRFNGANVGPMEPIGANYSQICSAWFSVAFVLCPLYRAAKDVGMADVMACGADGGHMWGHMFGGMCPHTKCRCDKGKHTIGGRRGRKNGPFSYTRIYIPSLSLTYIYRSCAPSAPYKRKALSYKDLMGGTMGGTCGAEGAQEKICNSIPTERSAPLHLLRLQGLLSSVNGAISCEEVKDGIQLLRGM